MRQTNRNRILSESIELFNLRGVAPVTTNHICERLDISPGNLYFHFRNKEAILYELFLAMCEETYQLWRKELQAAAPSPPMLFIEHSLEVFWRYRFFHREMYFLRRQDPRLSQAWHKHLIKTRHFMKAAYVRWVKKSWLKPIKNAEEMRALNDLILLTASSFFQFYESIEKPATRRPLSLANQYLGHFLAPYFTESYKAEVLRV